MKASTLEPALVFLTGTFKTKGGKYLRRVKVTSDVLRSGQDNQSGRDDTSTRQDMGIIMIKGEDNKFPMKRAIKTLLFPRKPCCYIFKKRRPIYETMQLGDG